MANVTVTFDVPNQLLNTLIPFQAGINPILVDSDRAQDLLAQVVAMIQEQNLRDTDITLLEPQ